MHFLTRLNAQAYYEVEQEQEGFPRTAPRRPRKATRSSPIATIALGSPNNRRRAVLEGVRLVTSENEKGEVHAFVTDRHDLAALEVISLYRKRWQIELFFRWLKRQSGHPGSSLRERGVEAVWLTMVVAAIVAVLWRCWPRSGAPKGMTKGHRGSGR